MSRGKITVGFGTSEQRDIEIVDFVQANFIDNRVITVSGLEDGSIVSSTENPASSGRNTQANLWLSRESFIGLMTTAYMYFTARGEDFSELLQSCVTSNDINYTLSDNLQKIEDITPKSLQQAEESLLKTAQEAVDSLKEFHLENKISDGYHTFNELYAFRKMYNAALFNEWASHLTTTRENGQALFNFPKYDVHKSWRHHDGELCFGGGWFIVVAVLPTGQISNHYKAEDWDLFKIPAVEKAKYPFDGHTPNDVIERLLKLSL